MSFFAVDIALVHYPVKNKEGETIGSALTNFDLHDLARAARTYGVDRVYMVTPYEDQQHLAAELLAHWVTGHGAKKNAKRKEALSLVEVCPDLDSLFAGVTAKWGTRPVVLATCAGGGRRVVSFKDVRQRVFTGQPHLILFGTAWGLADEVLDGVDGMLPSIRGLGDYNHLSVRSAVAIILDRLLGVHEEIEERCVGLRDEAANPTYKN